MDIFVSPKRFLGLYSYFEMGIDRRNDETRFLVAPSVGIQLGSLIGVHNFNMPGWLRIPLGIILPLKFAVTCNKVAGRPVEWISNIGKRPHGYRRNPLPIEAQGHADTRVGSYVYSCDLIDFTELDQGVKQTDPGILRQILYRDILGLYQAFIQ